MLPGLGLMVCVRCHELECKARIDLERSACFDDLKKDRLAIFKRRCCKPTVHMRNNLKKVQEMGLFPLLENRAAEAVEGRPLE
jgi:hypothetical protein